MTERGHTAVMRDALRLQIGPSSLRWDRDVLTIAIDEIAAPIPRRVRGTIRVTPAAFVERSFALDGHGTHVWQPIAPRATIAVELDRPALCWHGEGYLDSNYGAGPLETAFRQWSWSRAHLASDSVVLYDAERRDGSEVALALRFDADGRPQSLEPPALRDLKRSRWGIARRFRAAQGATTIRQTLEDTPFYARTLLDTELCGERTLAFHESLSLERFSSPVVRAMLPFRMPRSIF